VRTVLEVEIWSDVVCPWCYIGKRRFERAVDAVADEIDVRIVYRPFQLDPGARPGGSVPVRDAYARKFGGPEQADRILSHLTEVAAAEGLEFRMDLALRANTLLAHRLLWLTEATGHQSALKERLLQAYFHDGLDIGDPDVLADCAADVGLDRDRARAFLASDDGREEVLAEFDRARDREITAVPTYVFRRPDREQGWLVPGAQDPDTFEQVMRRLAAKAAADG
jgi:predicted DsbA family dithiol-disulfide isomerase